MVACIISVQMPSNKITHLSSSRLFLPSTAARMTEATAVEFQACELQILEEASSVLPSPNCPWLCIWPKLPGSGCRGYVIGSKSNERIDTRMDVPARTCLPKQKMFRGLKLGGLGALAALGRTCCPGKVCPAESSLAC